MCDRIFMIFKGNKVLDGTLEEIRLLSNLETDKEKLLQIILVGQLNLQTLLRSPDVTVSFADDGALLVSGLLAERIGAIAAALWLHAFSIAAAASSAHLR